MGTLAKIFGIALVIIMVAMTVVGIVTVQMPADTAYNQKFKSHETMIYDASSFEDIQTEINLILYEVDNVWHDRNLNTIYSTWWGPSQAYDNTVACNVKWLTSFRDTRLQGQIDQYENMVNNGTSGIYINDWYTQNLNNSISKAREGGGVVWAIHDAYYLDQQPMAYWLWWWLGAILVVLAIIAMICFLV